MESESEILLKLVQKSTARDRNKTSGSRSRSNRPRETEEEATIRRLHDAQRMARFRARKKKALEEQQQQQQLADSRSNRDEREADERVGETSAKPPETESKYSQLLAIIERLGRDVRLSYAGSRSSAERLKSGIVRARTLVRDCLIETKLNLRQ